MKKTSFMLVALLAAFGSGFAFHSVIVTPKQQNFDGKRVTGIGGIFFKSKDPAKMRNWYQTHLGLHTNQYGSVFEWRQGEDTTKKGFTQWSPFSEKTTYFAPSAKEWMINYRVVNLEDLVVQLRKEGVVITDTIESVEYGKFIHILDLEGNKIELWEPNDVEFEKLGIQIGATTTK